ncbi:MAG: epoxyqueuosine reductase QueH [Bacteroidales bacterium]|nr:epoxyqueuosine reductase QueH [Bacteroidales bacterium]
MERLGADEKSAPALFLHSCCAPCSSYVLEYLRQYFRITVFYFNPNITEDAEYRKRVAEQKRLIEAYNAELTNTVNESGSEDRLTDTNVPHDTNVGSVFGGKRHGCQIRVVEGDYEPARFFEMAKGLEACPEGGERCFACYALRLRETAERAKAGQYDYFTTTLSISPLKNAAKLNEIGEKLAAAYGVAWLPSDFKKRDGYKRSIELSKEYDLYRQDYCGCVYSRMERERQKRDAGQGKPAD